MHLVHYSERYDSVDTASANAEGLAVLGVFFEVSTLAVKNGAIFFTVLNIEIKYGAIQLRYSFTFLFLVG